MVHYVGNTTCPDKHRGPISKAIHDPHLTDQPIVNFEKIKSEFPEFDDEVHKDLSTDQLYLYDICHDIITGHIDSDLAFRRPGKMGHARWLTTASNILRLYVSTRSPTKQLKALVNIIIKFYAKMWFQIRSHPRAIDGHKNMFMMIELLREFLKSDQILLQKKIQNNAYYAHSENLLLTMLTDCDKAIQQKAVGIIKNIRAGKCHASAVESDNDDALDDNLMNIMKMN